MGFANFFPNFWQNPLTKLKIYGIITIENKKKRSDKMKEFLITFTVLSIINVIFSTVRSLVVNNGGKWLASILSGAYFAFYNIMVTYTVADFPMLQKCAITFVCNVVGVFIVKWGEEKARQDQLWKVEATILSADTALLRAELKALNISNHYFPHIGKYTKFEIFSETQKQSISIKKLLKKYNAKYFVSESKTL
jgi:hypothetical protein